MNRFDRYVLKIYLKYLFFVQLFIITISTVVSAMSHLDGLKKYGITLKQLAVLELLTFPMGINSTLPIVVVVACIITILLLMRNSELMAYVSLGGRVQRLLVPFIASSVMVAAFMLFFDNNIYSAVRYRQQKYASEEIKKSPYNRTDTITRIWMLDDDRNLVNIGFLNPLDNVATNIKKYVLDENSILKEIVTIQKAEYTDGKWAFINVSSVDFTSDLPVVKNIGTFTEESKLLSSLTSISGRSPRELSPRELITAIQILRERGQNPVKYEMLLGTKIANALSVIILTLLVTPVGINFSRNYSALRSAIVSFSIGGGFWAVSAAFNSLGSSGVLSPFVANYFPHIAFFGVGLLMLKLRS